jgi:hypothetical protein
MKVYIKGGGEVTLSKSQFIAAGGEGQIYASGNTAYKIYIDQSKMMPAGKIQELSEITDDNVIRPKEIILDQNKKQIGYTMRYVKQTYSLCQLFTKAFKDRNSITHQTIQDLVKRLRNMVEHIHSKNILVVDLNELNFLVDKDFNELYAIDTDSYMTPSYPATAIMESIKDYHTHGFNTNSDWFSFGVISFQMFIGLHPFKGSHPSIKGLPERMKNNVSVFNKDVSIPKVCYPLDVIPQVYRDWYRAVFEDGKRVAPPLDFQDAVNIITTINKIVGSNVFDIQELNEVDGNIVDILFFGGVRSILTDKRFYLNNRNMSVGSGITLCTPPQSDTVFLAKVNNGILKLYDSSTDKEIVTQIAVTDLMAYHGQLYVKNTDKILEVDITEIGDKVLVSSRIVANILENSSTVYDGVVVQNLLGAYYVSMFPSSKVHRQIRIKDLDEHRVIDAKSDNNVLMVVGVKDGKYDRFIIRFDKEWQTYDVRIIKDITHSGLNFAVLDNGTCITLMEDESIEVFSNKKDSANITQIRDDVIGSDMKLFAVGSKMMFSRANKLYSMTMKKKT